MLCILAFVVFLLLYPILGIFSPDYRRLFKKSWQCAFNRITFKPCDINLAEEIKGKLLGKIVFKYPKLGKFLDKSFDILALLFVVVSLWSLLYMLVAGVNLIVYDTCNPQDVESCALGGNGCGINRQKLTLSVAFQERRLAEYVTKPFTDFFTAVSLIPNRFRNWQADEFLPKKPSFYNFDKSNPTALEIVDPGCISCANLYKNIKQAKFTDRYNLTYILYPIPDSTKPSGTRFANSTTIAKYVEATKDFKLENQQIPGDWQLLSIIWDNAADPNSLQNQFNLRFNKEQAEQKLQEILLEIGYSSEQVQQIATLAKSEEIETRLKEQRKTVEDNIRTLRIPTIIFNGRRFDRVLEVDQLK
jgi:hypothetical protein